MKAPMKGGDCGPYFQSQRNDIYDAYFKELQDAGRVYEDEGAWRFRFDRSKPVTFHDLICGNITIDYRDASNTPGTLPPSPETAPAQQVAATHSDALTPAVIVRPAGKFRLPPHLPPSSCLASPRSLPQ